MHGRRSTAFGTKVIILQRVVTYRSHVEAFAIKIFDQPKTVLDSNSLSSSEVTLIGS